MMVALEQQLRARRQAIQIGADRRRRYRVKYRALEVLARIAKPDFGAFIFPVIRDMPAYGLLEQLVAVWPMEELPLAEAEHFPNAAVVYMDLVQGAR